MPCVTAEVYRRKNMPQTIPPTYFVVGCMVLMTAMMACETEPSESQEKTSTASTPQMHPQFEKLSSKKTGIHFANQLGEDRYRNILLYQYYYNGGGVAAGDIDNDGKTDLFFTGNTVPNKLYRNQGNFQFEDVSVAAGIVSSGSASWCTGVTMADVNADGWLDIYVSRSGNLQPENRENLLYINQQDGTFQEQAQQCGLNDPGYSIQAAFFDYDHDGDLDMFLVNHGMENYNGRVRTKSNQRDPYVGDKLFRNDAGHFTDVSEKAHIIGTPHSYGLGLAIGDVNRDGWDDIYVANDFYEHDYLYLNNQDGSFTESIRQTTRQISFFGMGVDIADYNNDLWPDIMVVDMAAQDHVRQKSNLAGISDAKFWDFVEKGYHFQYMYNSLQLNIPLPKNTSKNAIDIAFSNIARLAGVAQTDWSWAPLFADLDNDGWQDLLITNGLRKDVLNNDFVVGVNQELEAINARFVDLNEPEARSLLSQMPSQKIANYLYQNQGDLTFRDVSRDWGLAEATFSNGAAYADLNNDGHLDLIINNLDDVAAVYRNDHTTSDNHFLRVKLNGSKANPFGIGTKVIVYHQGTHQLRQLQTTRGYQSSVEPVLHFGAGKTSVIDSVQIVWPDGHAQTLFQVKTNRTLTVAYQDAKLTTDDNIEGVMPLVEDITDRIKIPYQHRESSYDDFDREFLLPYKLSDFGPALAVGDVDGDGKDDFFVGGAKGQSGQLYVQSASGNFSPLPDQPWQLHAKSEATDALFFDADNDQDLDLYVVNGSNEYEAGSEALQDHLYLNDGRGSFRWKPDALPAMHSFGTCVAATDLDGDNDLDLFVGGYTVPGKYPQPDRSWVLENQQGTFVDVTRSWAPSLLQPGLITDAQWIRVTPKDPPDLMVVGTWMPLQRYRNTGPALQAVPADSTYPTGWWFSLTQADWDRDGDDDILLGNISRNYRYHATPQAPFELYAHDFDENGSTDLLFGQYEQGKLYPVEERDRMYQQLPSIKHRFTDYDSYARATLPKLVDSTALQQAAHYSAQCFSSCYAEAQRGGVLAMKPLPNQAQFSAIRDALAIDINQDQHLDIVLAGNLYSVETHTPRLDASVGLVLLGNGQGSFTPLSPDESGFYAPGDARKLAKLSSPEGELVVVANNNGHLQLFHITRQRSSVER